jgi:hypothetical protein
MERKLYRVQATELIYDTVGSALVWAWNEAEAIELFRKIDYVNPTPCIVRIVRLGRTSRVLHTEFNAG